MFKLWDLKKKNHTTNLLLSKELSVNITSKYLRFFLSIIKLIIPVKKNYCITDKNIYNIVLNIIK